MKNLGAEAAAHIGRDHAQFVLGRERHEGGDDQARHMRVLRRVPQSEALGAGVVLADRRARFHRVGHQPVIADIELGHVLGGFESILDRLGVAKVPLVDGVAGRHFMDLRRASRLRRGRIGDRRQHVEIALHLLGGIPGLRQGLGDHDRNRIATWHAFTCASAGCGAIFMGEPSLEWINQPQMRLPILSAESSVPVRTANTPGIIAATLMSIFLILAWAWGERTK